MRFPPALLLAIAPVSALAACSVTGGDDRITIDVVITGDGVDRATVIREPRQVSSGAAATEFDPLTVQVDTTDPYEFEGDETMEVDLPWETTITVTDGPGADSFSIIAINPNESGSLTCEADWNQASGDGTWSRSNDFIAGCSASVSFSDDGTVRLDPGGRSVSLETRAEERAAIAAEVAADEQRVEELREAIATASPAGSVELDGWTIEPTGVNRDATEVLEAHSTENRFRDSERPILVELTVTRTGASPGRVTEVELGAVGGFDLTHYDEEQADCGPHIPDNWIDLADPELDPGETAVYNDCVVVDEHQEILAMARFSVFLGDDAPAVMHLPDSGVTGNRDVADAASGAVEFSEYETDWTIEFVGASVDDVDTISERLGDDVREPADGSSYVLVDVLITSRDPEDLGPVGPTWSADWRLESADGNRFYDQQDFCPGVYDVFPAEPAPDGGIDWNFGDDTLLLFPGEPKTFSACFEVPADDVAGSVLTVAGIEAEVNLATGL